MELIEHKGVISFETRLKTFDGRIIWVNDNARAITDENGEVTQYEGVMVDITERRETEEKMRRLIGNLRESKQTIEKNAEEILDLNYELLVSEAQLKDMNESKDKFISIIAHDLSTPFNGFLGLSQMMKDEAENLSAAEVKEMAEALFVSAKTSHKLLEDLLEWGKLQKGTYETKIERVNIYENCRLNIEMYSSIAKEKKIEMANNVPEKLHYRTDKNILNTVLRNLITNSLKFTPVGGRIEIDVNMLEDGLELIISDDGHGMDEETLENIFRIDKPRPKIPVKERGSGLGLILCRELLQKINSSIRADSVAGRGTAFVIKLAKADDYIGK
jgi:signal transduction histidine kinase